MNNRGLHLMVVLMMSTCASVNTGNLTQHNPKNFALEIPQLAQGDDFIQHAGFALAYDETHEQAKWVAYELTLEETIKGVERSGKFLPDPKVVTGTATNEDYKGSGYDRGHLAPAADMSWSDQAMQQSFYFSNISPQVPSFNRGIWKKLEDRVRKWAKQDTSIFIVTGSVLTENLSAIGPNRVTVPAHFYKALLVYRDNNQKAIAFILPNEKSGLPLHRFAVTIDSLERLTGLNFFPALPDSVEANLENEICFRCWGLEQ